MQNFSSFGRVVWSGPWGGWKIDFTTFNWRPSVDNYSSRVESKRFVPVSSTRRTISDYAVLEREKIEDFFRLTNRTFHFLLEIISKSV